MHLLLLVVELFLESIMVNLETDHFLLNSLTFIFNLHTKTKQMIYQHWTRRLSSGTGDKLVTGISFLSFYYQVEESHNTNFLGNRWKLILYLKWVWNAFVFILWLEDNNKSGPYWCHKIKVLYSPIHPTYVCIYALYVQIFSVLRHEIYWICHNYEDSVSS